MARSPESASGPPNPGIEALVPVPARGRKFQGQRRVRLGDVDVHGRLRLDALTRYTQDVSNDDTNDASLIDDMAWVVRKTTVDVLNEASFGEHMTLTTFCGALGSRWAERRVHVVGSLGARYEVATLWVHIDVETGRPKPLSSQFVDLYGEAAGGRTVKARLHHLAPPDDASWVAWPLRTVDFDTFGHVNNAAYWSVVEEVLDPAGRLVMPEEMSVPHRAVLEYGSGILPQPSVDLAVELAWLDATAAECTGVWWRTSAGVMATAELSGLPENLYEG